MAKRNSKLKEQEQNQIKYFTSKNLHLTLTKNQKRIVNNFIENKITILTGDPGTGKTTIALHYAIRQLLEGEFERIIISKNPVETGASIGFLPGEIEDKLAPYKQSYIDVIVKLVGKLKANDLIKGNKIVFEPIGFVRGKTFENAVIVGDEIQNLDLGSLISFISRIDHTSKIILLGDEFQTDINKTKSGLMPLLKIVEGINSIKHIELGDEFQMRAKIITDIYKNYKKFLNSK